MILIFYGSETGTSRKYSKRLSSYLTFHKKYSNFVYDLAQIIDYDALKATINKSIQDSHLIGSTVVLIFVASTVGIGEPPSSCLNFQKFLRNQGDCQTYTILDKLDQDLSINLKFCVLGLGDSAREHFCVFAKEIDSILAYRSKKRVLLKMGVLDADASPEIYEKKYVEWRQKLVVKLSHLKLVHADPVQALLSFERRFTAKEVETRDFETTVEAINPGLKYVKIQDVLMIRADVMKVILRFSKGDDLNFTPAGTIKFIPENDPEKVFEVAKKLGLNLNQILHLEETKGKRRSLITSSFEVLSKLLDLNAKPNPDFLEQLQLFSPNSKYDFVHNYPPTIHKSLLGLDDGDLESARSALTEKLKDFNILLGLLPEITHRQYTIANAPQNQPGEEKLVELCIRVLGNVRDDSNQKLEPVPGLNSNFLMNLYRRRQTSPTESIEQQIPVLVSDSIFSKVDYSNKNRIKQFIIVGTGTGVTVAKSIVEHLQFLAHTNDIKSKVVLFFGFKDESDFLYKRFFEDCAAEKAGNLEVQLFVALSREAPNKKVYVQRLMQENKRLILGLFKPRECYEEPIVCMAGSGRMARGAKDTMKKIIGQVEVDRKVANNSYLVEAYN